MSLNQLKPIPRAAAAAAARFADCMKKNSNNNNTVVGATYGATPVHQNVHMRRMNIIRKPTAHMHRINRVGRTPRIYAKPYRVTRYGVFEKHANYKYTGSNVVLIRPTFSSGGRIDEI